MLRNRRLRRSRIERSTMFWRVSRSCGGTGKRISGKSRKLARAAPDQGLLSKRSTWRSASSRSGSIPRRSTYRSRAAEIVECCRPPIKVPISANVRPHLVLSKLIATSRALLTALLPLPGFLRSSTRNLNTFATASSTRSGGGRSGEGAASLSRTASTAMSIVMVGATADCAA